MGAGGPHGCWAAGGGGQAGARPLSGAPSGAAGGPGRAGCPIRCWAGAGGRCPVPGVLPPVGALPGQGGNPWGSAAFPRVGRRRCGSLGSSGACGLPSSCPAPRSSRGTGTADRGGFGAGGAGGCLQARSVVQRCRWHRAETSARPQPGACLGSTPGQLCWLILMAMPARSLGSRPSRSFASFLGRLGFLLAAAGLLSGTRG